MKVVCVAGKNNIAVEVLQYLEKHNFGRYQLCVVCDKTENGINTQQKSLRFFAQKLKIRECELRELYSIEDLVLLSLEFDQIIRPDKFATEKLYNIHFSLLPAYKGVYTSVWPILNGEKYSGVTLHYMEQGIDTGNIIAQKKFCIEGMNCRDLYQANMKYGKELILENIEELIMGRPTSYPQPVEGSSYYSKYSIDYSRLEIDLNQTAETICNQIRAFSYREFQLPEVYHHKIIDAKVMPGKSKGKPGTIIMETPEALLLNTIDYNVVMFFDRFDELMQACGRGDMYAIKSICTVSRHVNDYDVTGRTPLMAAILADEKEAVKFLLAQGANVNAADNNGRTVLMYAETAYVKNNDSTIFNLLKVLGAKMDMEDYAGYSVYDYIKRDNLTAGIL